MPSTKKVLVDTFTLFSGLGWSGPPSQILIAIAEGSFELVVTDHILDEFFRHLQDFPTERKEPALRSFEYLHQAIVIEDITRHSGGFNNFETKGLYDPV